MTQQEWLTLGIAILGIVGTLTGALLTQWRANKREEKRWQEEHRREQRRWEREDALRTFDHRRDAYIEYLAKWRHYFNLLWDHEYHPGPAQEPPEDLLEPLWERFTVVMMYGSPEAIGIAEKMYDALYEWVFRSGETVRDDVTTAFIEQARTDLKVPRSETAKQDRTNEVTKPEAVDGR
jgi:hypothetical protein